VGAALLALCDLGQVELAVTVLGNTWHAVGKESGEDPGEFVCPPPL